MKTERVMQFCRCVFLIILCPYFVRGQADLYAFRCYGTGWVMDESCPANHKMFPIEVRVGATGLATGCPNSIVKGTNTSLESTCCNHSDAACLDTYHNTLNDTITYVYHEMCMGRKQCVNYPIVRSTTTGPVVFCDQSLYHSTTTVLELKYHCIQDEKFLSLSNSISISKANLSDVHIVLQNYSSSGIPSTTTDLQCSIETSECDGQIRINAKDLRLFFNTSQCFQRIYINDTDDGVIHDFDCSHNTNFIQNANFYTSQHNHIIIHFTNSYDQNGGFVWIKPTPVNTSHTLSINCPPKEENLACFPTTTTEETTTSVDTTTETTPHITEVSNKTMQSRSDPTNGQQDIALIAGIVTAVIICISIGIGIVCAVKMKWKTKQSINDISSQEERRDSRTSTSIQSTSQIIIPLAHSSPATSSQLASVTEDLGKRTFRKQNSLSPLQLNPSTFIDEENKKAKRKKKKKKKDEETITTDVQENTETKKKKKKKKKKHKKHKTQSQENYADTK